MQTLKITVKIETVCPFCESPIVINDDNDKATLEDAQRDYLEGVIGFADDLLITDEGIFCGDDCHEKYLSRHRSERREDMEMNR